jgi:hypothetical protein
MPATFALDWIASVTYLCSGGIALIGSENWACLTGSTGRCFIFVLAGLLSRKFPSFQFFDGLIGLGTKPPPQLGQTLPKTLSTHETQKVHS